MDISLGYPSHIFQVLNNLVLALTDSEHLGTATGTNPLRCRPAVLHGNALGILHFPLCPALNAVCLH